MHHRGVELIVLAKEPVPGRVKTRLCPPCTADQAAVIAEAALADTLAAATASGADRVIVALDGQPGPWCPPGVVVVAQGTGSLSARLATAWRFATGPALQVGMDTPQVGADVLDAAMGALVDGAGDAVLGPACDGGWWAIGMRRPRPDVFESVETSRSDTGARQLHRLAELGLRPALLDVQRDIDTWDDVLEVALLVPAGAFAAAVGAITGDSPDQGPAR